MEIYRNSTNARVHLVAPASVVAVGDEVDATARSKDGDILHTFDVVYRTDTSFSVELPWSLTRIDSQFNVHWEFSYVEGSTTKTIEEDTEVNVVTPVLSLSEVERISGLTDAAEIADLERRVRFAIQTYTGTTFGKFHGTIPVSGTGDSKLGLPLPLLTLESPDSLSIFANGMFVGAQNKTYYAGGIKSAPPEEVLDQFAMSVSPIKAPLSSQRIWFTDNVQYNITGVWGYNDVPEDVRQAARLLCADYACDESLWRDRYITIMKSGDWSIQFAGGAFTGTGNVGADQILVPYRRTSLVII